MLQTPITKKFSFKKAIGAEKPYHELSDIQHLTPDEIYHLNPKQVSKDIFDRDDASLLLEQQRALKILLGYRNYLKTLPNTIEPITQEQYINETLNTFKKELNTRKASIKKVNNEFKLGGKGKSRRSSRKVKGSRKVKKSSKKFNKSMRNKK